MNCSSNCSSNQLRNFFPAKKDEIPPQHLPKMIIQKNYLANGNFIQSNTPDNFQVLSPIYINSQQVSLGEHPHLNREEVLSVLSHAQQAWKKGNSDWATSSTSERIRCVENFVKEMQLQKNLVVNTLMWEICKNYPDAEKEFDRTIDYIKETIHSLKELDRISSRFVIEQKIIGQIRRSPLGVVLCMGPFNYPLNETFTTLIPALIMGNVVIFKPAKFGVLLWNPLLPAFAKSFPPGVINVVYGEGKEVITPLMSSGGIDVLAFIGSGKVADVLKKHHPSPHRLRSVLGLEAKNAAIVLEDADIQLAVEELLLGTLSYNGQRCTAIKIIFLHRSVADKFLSQFSDKVSALKIGMPWEDGVKITPLPEDEKCLYLNGLVEDAITHGAKIITGGSHHRSLFTPTVLSPVNAKMRVWREEQFGPVVPIAIFDQIEEPINYIIESSYGQQTSIFGTNEEKIATLVDHLVNQVSRVNINSQCQRGPDSFPFTGRKDSAEGTLSVSDALRVFSIRTLVAAKENNLNKTLLSNITYNHQSKFLNTDFIF
ncbi:MAG: NADP-dependent glyceraldehyde-3-phosphate dehydrogenase [Oligoflexia bacterium]|nr:NADP-dependent glyceraldehyde-3-phosphate dehydrogenase [Oligoflexia bacterium]